MRPDLSIEEIIKVYQDKVFNTCLGFLKNVEEAEDVAQEVFIKVYKNLNSFKGNAAIGTWIYRIAVNQCMEDLRKTKRIRQFTGIPDDDNSSQSWIDHTSDFYHPGVSLENKEKANILFKAIDRLPEQQKIAFTLHKVEGLSYDEISNIMDKSLSSVESLMHRAKQNLKHILKDYHDGK